MATSFRIDNCAEDLAVLLTSTSGIPAPRLGLANGTWRAVHQQAGALRARLHAAGAPGRADREEAEASLQAAAFGAERYTARAGDRLSEHERQVIRDNAAQLRRDSSVPVRYSQRRNWLWFPAGLALVDFERTRLAARVQDRVILTVIEWRDHPDRETACLRSYGRELTGTERHALWGLTTLDVVNCAAWGRDNDHPEVTDRGWRTLGPAHKGVHAVSGLRPCVAHVRALLRCPCGESYLVAARRAMSASLYERAAHQGRSIVTVNVSTTGATYWEPLWAGGRRYRRLCDAELRLMNTHIGPGVGRPALDVGSGDGALARHLHHDLGYRTTGADCSSSALALASAQDTGAARGPAWRCWDITTGDLNALPDAAYAVVTCRLVYRWMEDKVAFVERVRRLLAPAGTFWVVTEIAGRRATVNPALRGLGITEADAELLTAGWSTVRTADLDVLRCYALRP